MRKRKTHIGTVAHKNSKRVQRNGNESKSNLRGVPVRHPAVCHSGEAVCNRITRICSAQAQTSIFLFDSR